MSEPRDFDDVVLAQGTQATEPTSAASAAAGAYAPVPTRATRTWNPGTTDDWYDTASWTTTTPATTTTTVANSYPLPGDTAVIGSGIAKLIGSEAKNSGTFSGNFVTLGSASGTGELELVDATVGGFFNVTTAGDAALLSNGVSTFNGNIYAQNAGATLTLGSFDNGSQAGNLELQQGSFSVGETLAFQGTVTVEGRAAFTAPTVVNNGTVNLIGNTNSYVNASPNAVAEPFNHDTGDVTGTGTFNLQFDSKLEIDGAVAAGQTIQFGGADTELSLANPAGFAGQVTGFGVGDQIDFAKTAFDSSETAAYSATAQTLTLSNASGVLATLQGVQAQTGTLTVGNDGSGQAVVGYASALPPATYGLQGGDDALRANVVRQTMDVPGTATPIDGTGITIGIISGGFNSQGQAAANQAAGYLPSGTNLVDARDNPNAPDDEGQAMAEVIHQIAPGAKIVFASDVDGEGSAAQLLQSKYNVQVIADDIAQPAEPYDQIDMRPGKDDTDIQQVVNSNVDYFLASGNYGQAFYANTFTPTSRTLSDGSTVGAQTFSNGTPYELITVPATTANATTLNLQWSAPIDSTTTTPLSIKVFDTSGNAVGNGTTGADMSTAFVNGIAGARFVLPASAAYTTYRVAIYEPLGATTSAPDQFEFTLEKGGSGESPGGIIDDPAAGTGPGNLTGPELIPGVNTVGAISYANSAAFGLAPVTNIAETSFGPGALLYDQNGTAYATPVKNDFSAPVGVDTTVTGFTPFFGSSAAAPAAAAVAALMLQANPNLTTAQVTSLLEQSAIPFGNPDQSGAGLIQADVAVQEAIAMVCFAAGTRIATARGDIAVEHLLVGDLAVTKAGPSRPIVWLGHRAVDCRRHPRPHEVMPIRIAAHAFSEDRPARDLRVSPGHAICVDAVGEVLIPASALVNGATIARVDVETVTYWHVELASHDIVLAENLPCESYLEMGNRTFFVEAPATALNASPDAAIPTHADFCRPFHDGGVILACVRERLHARALALGWRREGRLSDAQGPHQVALKQWASPGQQK